MSVSECITDFAKVVQMMLLCATAYNALYSLSNVMRSTIYFGECTFFQANHEFAVTLCE